jgi:hypothetical protein
MSGNVATTANHHEVEMDGIVRDLRHLREFVVTVKGKGKDGADLKVAVRLGRHTVSKACPVGQQHNMTDENGKPRIFCEDRYAFSLDLPTLARRMIEQSYFCWESLDQNRAMNYAVIDVPPGAFHTLKDGEYQVMFFYLYPADGEDEADVNLVVASCHMRGMKFHSHKRRYNVHVLLRTCLYKQKRIP